MSILLRRSLRCSHLRPLLSSSISPRPPTLLPSASVLLRSFSSSPSKIKGKASSLPLSSVLDREITKARESDVINREVDLPDNFPFEIIDNPGDESVILKRDFGNEKIQVTVFMNLETEHMDENDSEDDNTDSYIDLSLSLVVAVDKGDGPFLEFGCSLSANELKIRTMVLKKHDDPDDQSTYQGPDFSDLDEDLQKSLHNYLHVRGVDGSLFDFLHEYMENKDEREFLTWLKNMKEFVGN